MNCQPYQATVRIQGVTIRTRVCADGATHARLLLEYLFGFGSVVAGPTLERVRRAGFVPIAEVLATIKPRKPLTPAQTRIQGLKQRRDAASRALDAERQRQRISKATHSLARVPPV